MNNYLASLISKKEKKKRQTLPISGIRAVIQPQILYVIKNSYYKQLYANTVENQ